MRVLDHAQDAFLKTCLGPLAFLIEWSNATPVVALKTFLDGPETASDFDELQIMDEVIQKEISDQLRPFLKANWQDQLSQAIVQAAPQWRLN